MKKLQFGKWVIFADKPMNMIFRIGKLMCIISIIVMMPSCRKDHYKVNVSRIRVDVNVKHLEKDLFTIDPEQILPSVPALRDKYGRFLQLFSYVINTGEVSDSAFGEYLVKFCTDRQNNEVFGEVQRVFPDFSLYEKALEDAFRHYLYYLPGRTVPVVYTCITGFNNSIITGDSILGISLDRYLGADSKYYPMLGIYSYVSQRMTPENLVPDCIYGWAASEWDYQHTGYPDNNALSYIFHEGKLKYYEKCMLPRVRDEILFGFTEDQMKFCRNNELQMWQYLIEHDLLFSTDHFVIRKLTGEAPFTSYFTSESPGKAAVWIGFKIVESMMIRNPGIGLEELMKMTDLQMILEKAKYDPK